MASKAGQGAFWGLVEAPDEDAVGMRGIRLLRTPSETCLGQGGRAKLRSQL